MSATEEDATPPTVYWASAPSGAPGPADLLAARLLKNVERSSRLLPFRYHRAEVDVQVRRQDTPPRFTALTYELRLVTDEPQRRIDLLHQNLRRFGTVYNTLAAVCDVDGTVVPIALPAE
ncbi:OsmC family protein [Kitasatospora sp. NPDC057542]|uniref:OsmC family protein n=1 Tax=Kitasatospora sp. NPDC057542 TaxID=3346162 RepID=UPI003696BFF3